MSAEKAVMVLMCATHRFPGAVHARCRLDRTHIVWEDPKNLEVIRRSSGWIICIDCALELKDQFGDKLPMAGQMWEGGFREIQDVIPPYRAIVEKLKK